MQAKEWGPQLPWSKQVSGQKVPAGSLGWWWAVGCLCRVWWEVEGETQPWGIGVSLLAGHPACCHGLSPAVSPSGSEQCPPESLREGGEAGLGEVERFISGEQAAGESRGGQLLEPTLAPRPCVPHSHQLSLRLKEGLPIKQNQAPLLASCQGPPNFFFLSFVSCLLCLFVF